jgi:general secretion pathway protein C
VAVHSDGSSYCIIEDLTTRKQELYRINDAVAGSASVKQIEWDRVILDRDGQDEILELANPEGGAPGGTSRFAAASRFSGPGAASTTASTGGASSDPHIQQVSDNQFVIDRSEVDSALDNMNQLFTQIRAVPHFEGGRSTGFRLFAIRQNSIFDKIGLKNGDIIQRINGADLSDPARALALFQELRNEQNLTVDIVRNKQNQTLSYQFR